MKTQLLNSAQEKLNNLMTNTLNQLSEKIDQFLLKNGQETDWTLKMKSSLVKAKSAYNELPKPRLVHLNFIFRVIISYLVVAVFFNHIVAYKVVGLYAGYIFLNKMPWISTFVNFVTDTVVLIAGFFMPGAIKDLFGFVMKYAVQFSLTLSIGTMVAPFYLAYRSFLFFKPNTVTPSIQ